MTIEQAQQAKMHHVCASCSSSPARPSSSGSGWAASPVHGENYDVHVRTFNISKEQIAFARDWSKRRGLEHLVDRRGRLPEYVRHVRRVRLDRHARARWRG